MLLVVRGASCWGRAGRAGGWSPLICGVMGPLAVLFGSSRSLLLFAKEWWTGGGSNPTAWNVFDRASGSGGEWDCMGGLGRVGSIGGESFSGLPLLLGGLLNGETLSLSRRVLISKAWLASGRYEAREGISGFSALLTGGGAGLASLKSLSRRSSVDRRGGGGEGG